MKSTSQIPYPIRVTRVVGVGGPGGIGSQLLVVADLIDRFKYELEVVFLTHGGSTTQQLVQRNIKVHELNLPSERLLRTGIPKLYQLLKKKPPHIIHSSSATASLCSAVAARLAKIPVIIGEEVCIPNRRKRARLKYHLSHQLSHKVVAVSNAVADYLHTQEYCPKSKLHVLHNSYPIAFDQISTRSFSSVSTNEPYKLIAVGRLEPEKNQILLLQMMRELVETHHLNCHLTLVGDGSMRLQLEDFVEQHDLGPYIRFTGFRTDVVELLKSSHVYLLPSTTEAFGIALTEAMQCGLPFIASRVGGVLEVAKSYPSKYLIPPHAPSTWTETVLTLHDLPWNRHQELGALARKISEENFSPRAHLDALNTLYIDLFSTKIRD